jgi:murein DD-endopeptidase MepM/ murein hydrolase activator NlpD
MADLDRTLQTQNVELDVKAPKPDNPLLRALIETRERADEIEERFRRLQETALNAGERIVTGLADLAFLSRKLDTPISQLKSLDFAFEQIGARPAQALSNLQVFYDQVQRAPSILGGFVTQLGKYGFQNVGSIADKYESAMKALAKEMASGPEGEMRARWFARSFGLDTELIEKLAHEQEEFDRARKEEIERSKDIDKFAPDVIELYRSFNDLTNALRDTAELAFGDKFKSVSEILDSWTKWIRENQTTIAETLRDAAKEVVDAGKDIGAIFGPIISNASSGFVKIGDAVSRVLGVDDRSGMRGIRYLLDTMATLLFGSTLLRLIIFLNAMSFGALPKLIKGVLSIMGLGTSAAATAVAEAVGVAGAGAVAGATVGAAAGLYKTVQPQPLGEGEDEQYRQAHPGWTPESGVPKDPNWRPPAAAPAPAPTTPSPTPEGGVAAPPGGLPAAGRVTGMYSDQRSGHLHAGWDIAGPMGSPIVSPTGGKVLEAQRRSGYGLTIDVLSPDGKHVFRYAHLQGMNVKAGDVIQPGHQIATMGNTGTSHEGGPTGVHLHTEVHDAARYFGPHIGGQDPRFGRRSTIDPAQYYGNIERNARVELGGQRSATPTAPTAPAAPAAPTAPAEPSGFRRALEAVQRSGQAKAAEPSHEAPAPAAAPTIANPLERADKEGFHRALRGLQRDSIVVPPQPTRIRDIGSRVYKNNITVMGGDDPQATAAAVASSIEKVHKQSLSDLAPLHQIGGELRDIPSIPDETLRTVAQLETRGGQVPDRPRAPFRGTYQMSPDFRRRFGGDDPATGQPWPRGSEQEQAAAKRAIAQVASELRKSLGREPTDAETYLGWNQGVKGASNILAKSRSHPEAPATRPMRAQSREIGGREKTVGGFVARERAAVERARTTTAPAEPTAHPASITTDIPGSIAHPVPAELKL